MKFPLSIPAILIGLCLGAGIDHAWFPQARTVDGPVCVHAQLALERMEGWRVANANHGHPVKSTEMSLPNFLDAVESENQVRSGKKSEAIPRSKN